MKTKNFVVAFIIMLSGSIVFAQKAEVNIQKSSIKWSGKKIGTNHEGTIQLNSGYIELQDDKILAGNFVVDMTSITNTDRDNENYNQKLVGHLKSDDFFGVDEYPTAHFDVRQSTKFTNGKATISGEITIKGKKENISFEVERSGNEYSAKVDIDRSKFNVRYGSDKFFDNLGDKAIDNIFILDITLVVL
jgi:polyisoprenoid-binding protein YceI